MCDGDNPGMKNWRHHMRWRMSNKRQALCSKYLSSRWALLSSSSSRSCCRVNTEREHRIQNTEDRQLIIQTQSASWAQTPGVSGVRNNNNDDPVLHPTILPSLPLRTQAQFQNKEVSDHFTDLFRCSWNSWAYIFTIFIQTGSSGEFWRIINQFILRKF